MTDNSGTGCNTALDSAEVMVRPAIDFTVEGPAVVCRGDRAKFSVASEQKSDGLPWRWVFEDGSETQGEMSERLFDRAGVFEIRLQLGNLWTVAHEVTVVDLPAVNLPDSMFVEADEPFLIDPTAGTLPNEKLVWSWQTGDGATAADRVLNHRFKKAGAYTVLLTVRHPDLEVCQQRSAKSIVVVSGTPAGSILLDTDEVFQGGARDEVVFSADHKSPAGGAGSTPGILETARKRRERPSSILLATRGASRSG